MFTNTMHRIAIRLTAPDDKAVAIDTGSLKTWLQDNAVPVVVLLIGLVLLGKSQKGDSSGVFLRVGLVAASLAVVTIGIDNTTGIGIGRWLIGLVGIHPTA